jgi:hypothetical protein
LGSSGGVGLNTLGTLWFVFNPVFIMFGETQSHAQSIHVSFMKFLMYNQIDDIPQIRCWKCGNDP